MDDVIIVNFGELSDARRAMAELRRLNDDGAIAIRAAAIVVRDGDGRFWAPEDEESLGLAGTATGGAIGALLGALAGPLGMLFFGATGALIGSLADAEQAEVSEGVLASVTRSIPPGTATVVADIDEPTPVVVDGPMQALGGTVSRRARAEVEAELAAAEEAAGAARREAERVLRERRKAAGEQTFRDRLAELKETETRRG